MASKRYLPASYRVSLGGHPLRRATCLALGLGEGATAWELTPGRVQGDAKHTQRYLGRVMKLRALSEAPFLGDIPEADAVRHHLRLPFGTTLRTATVGDLLGLPGNTPERLLRLRVVLDNRFRSHWTAIGGSHREAFRRIERCPAVRGRFVAEASMPETPTPAAPDVRVGDVLDLLRRGELPATLWTPWLMAVADATERASAFGSVEQRLAWHIDVVCTGISGEAMPLALWRRLGIDGPQDSLATCAKTIGCSREWIRILERRLKARIHTDRTLCRDMREAFRNRDALVRRWVG